MEVEAPSPVERDVAPVEGDETLDGVKLSMDANSHANSARNMIWQLVVQKTNA